MLYWWSRYIHLKPRTHSAIPRQSCGVYLYSCSLNEKCFFLFFSQYLGPARPCLWYKRLRCHELWEVASLNPRTLRSIHNTLINSTTRIFLDIELLSDSSKRERAGAVMLCHYTSSSPYINLLRIWPFFLFVTWRARPGFYRFKFESMSIKWLILFHEPIMLSQHLHYLYKY